MSLIHNWSKPLPEDCVIHYVKQESDWIVLGLYCSDSIEEISINIINGKIQKHTSSEAELKGFSEYRKSFYVVSSYRGLNKRLWSRVEYSLNSKIICRQNLCVVASMKPNHILEVKLVNANNEVLETINVENTYDFQIGASLYLIVVTATGIKAENSSTIIIDPATQTVLDYINGFGGYVTESTDYLFVYGFSKGKYVTKIYDSHGGEVSEIDGIPVTIPFNPLTYRVHRDKLFDIKYVGVIDKNDVKIIDPVDFSIQFTSIKPPFTRGILSAELDSRTVTVYSIFSGKSIVVKYDVNGAPLLVSHEISNLRYGLFSDKIVAIYVEREFGETRIYRVVDNILVHEESFGPNVYPLVIKGDVIILTDSKKISSYSME